MPSQRMLTLMEELEREDPNLNLKHNRERFVDATIQDAKDSGKTFEDEEDLRRDALAYLEGLLDA